MIAIVFEKNDGSKAFVSADYGTGVTMPGDNSFKQNAVDVVGGVLDDYLVYKTDDVDIKVRIFQQDSFIGTIEDNEVTGIDFSLEDNKQWVKIETDVVNNRQRLYLNGSSDELNINATIYQSDKVTIDTSFNETVTINCITPSGKVIPIDAVFSEGTHSERFYPTDFGYYIIPEDKIHCSDGQLKVIEQLKIEVFYKAE